MKILIVAPTERENKYMNNSIARLRALGKQFRNEYKVIRTGVGKVNAAMEVSLELNADLYDLVVVVGFAAGSAYFKQGDVVIPDSTAYWDVCIPEGFVPEMTKEYPLQGSDDVTILTGDSFITKSFAESLVSNFGAKAIYDMETAAVAQVSEEYNVPVLALKIVSDVPSLCSDSMQTFEEFVNTNTDFAPFLNYLEAL